ncbi:hypothetical protein CCE02nite_33400 [Cellulosimicrobium cellulans]|uniref:Lipoprotein n=1 Tax=Cellulosimicrobium cellulans TaxID=1710 RepID=A0A4Y4E9L2_CELCE|nr:hypothetical protein CCE02nite_33400 [Cellulosimicrobium cellulans]
MQHYQRLAAAAVVAACVAGLGGCAASPSAAPTATTAAPPPEVSTPEPGASAPDTLAPDDDTLARAAAVAALTDFVARDRAYEDWWGAFAPHLTPAARQAFEFTDPTSIPAATVTDDGALSAAPDGTSASVLVGTDAGQYRVELVRQSVDAPWLVDRLTPPGDA